MEMDGIIVKYLFHSQKDGYTIAIFRPDGINGNVTIMGHHLPLPIKQSVRVKGIQVENKKYDTLQYQITDWEELEPPDPYRIIEYLSSGIIKGLGSALAQKIVAKFGVNTIQVMRNEIDRLKEIPGIGIKLIEAIQRDLPR